MTISYFLLSAFKLFRLKLQKIGDYYRGWVANDAELELLLTLHKQQTKSVWGTRQSPSMSRETTRLMWRSQYCPFDGIPFLNTGLSTSAQLKILLSLYIFMFYFSGSRAIVMECQFGPRRKGSSTKKEEKETKKFKKTCPARFGDAK